MRISDFIKQLQDYQKVYGNLQVVLPRKDNDCKLVMGVVACDNPKCNFGPAEVVIV